MSVILNFDARPSIHEELTAVEIRARELGAATVELATECGQLYRLKEALIGRLNRLHAVRPPVDEAGSPR
jgi:hypothetical protein